MVFVVAREGVVQSQQYMYVRFKSDYSNVYSGFTAALYPTSASPSPSPSPNSATCSSLNYINAGTEIAVSSSTFATY